jgi:hypothetical protein
MRRAQTFSPARAYGQLSVPLGSDFEFEKLLPALTILALTILQGAILAHQPPLLASAVWRSLWNIIARTDEPPFWHETRPL